MIPTITIGISAFNEEANIKKLLESLLLQKGDYQIEKIIVSSDGSTDSTVDYATEVIDPRINVISNTERMGKAHRLNEICQISESDILVVLDADVVPENENLISSIIEPIVHIRDVGFTSGPAISLNPKNLFEKTLVWGLKFKTDLFESMKPNNVFLCIGAIRAFRKSLYKKLHWPPGYPEDGFSYLASIQLGYKFKYQRSARVIFRVPDNFADHLNQSRRFINSTNRLKKHFSIDYIKDNYRIPANIFIQKMFKFFLKNPLYSLLYCLICVYPRIIRSKVVPPDKWNISLSTKKLIN